MQTKGEWNAGLTEYFASIDRNLDIDSGKDSLKVFCIEERKDGLIKTEFLSTKLRNMKEQITSDEQYDKEMRRLIDNGSIRYYEEGNIEGKTLSLHKADQSTKLEHPQEEKLVAKGMGLASDRGGFWSKLWDSIKSIFSPKVKINQAAERFFDNFQGERSQEIIKEKVEKDKREKTREKAIQSEKIISQLESRETTQKTFENNLQNVFGKKMSVSPLKENGYNINAQQIPIVDVGDLAQKYDFCKPENMQYLELCMTIAAQKDNIDVPPNLMQTAVIENCLAGKYNSVANENIEQIIIQGKENTNECLQALKQGDFSKLGRNIGSAVGILNEMIGTCQPEKYIDLNSNCMLTAKCIKETMNIVNSSPELKSSTNIDKYDLLAANGASAMWDIADKSHKAQKVLCYGGAGNVKEQAKHIENDIKMRGALCNNAYLSDWHGSYRELAAKRPNDASNFKDQITMVQAVRNKKSDCPNLAIYELGDNPQCFNVDNDKMQLKENVMNKNPHDIMLSLSKLIKNNAEMYAKNKHVETSSGHLKPHESTSLQSEKQDVNDRSL